MLYEIDDLIHCVQKECRLRQSLFPDLVAEGSMTKEEAEREITLMIAVREQRIQTRNEPSPSL